jgi:acetyltransferase-like isoleucine patch superfamily enzyme
MAVDLVDKGTDNVLEVHPWYRQNGRLRVEFLGSNGLLRMSGVPQNCSNMHIQLGNRSTVNIGEKCRLTDTFIFAAEHCCVQIGRLTTFTARARLLLHEPSSIKIGEDCMIASDVQFMTSDSHTIYACDSGERLNKARDIEVGDHVWISLQCFVLKGARIGSGSVIGMRSVVTGHIPSTCMAVGTPARVVRERVSWDRKLRD